MAPEKSETCSSLTIILFGPPEQEMQNIAFTDFFFVLVFFLINTSFPGVINIGSLEGFLFQGCWGEYHRKQLRNFVTIIGSIMYNHLFSRNRKACVFTDEYSTIPK